jgi:prolyl oligopeptidase
VSRHVICGFAFVVLAVFSSVSAAEHSPGSSSVLHYPAPVRGPVVDSYHGTEVPDPYRWMETPSTELSAWVAAQNELSQPYLDAIPARETIRKRLTELWDYEQYGYNWLDDKYRVPVKKGGRYFFVERAASRTRASSWAESLTAAPRVLVDANALSADATHRSQTFDQP